ncbi:voltage-gated purine nucleotide uniporter SLC17A9 isoform X2 [Lissotriton helveticus]
MATPQCLQNGFTADLLPPLLPPQHPDACPNTYLGEKRSENAGPYWTRQEYRVWTVMLLLGTCLLYCARVTMPICSVSMSTHFNWDKKQTGMVLSSFFWGYCLTQIIGGHLSDKIGGEKVLLMSALSWGLITVATPVVAHMSSVPLFLVILFRFLMGLLQGVYFPALTSLLSQRVRENERAFTCCTVGSGSQFGTLVIGGAGSLLLDWYGWESVFFFSGSLALLWVYYMYKQHFSENEHIISLEDITKNFSLSTQTNIPWRRLFRKRPVWAVIIGQLCIASTFFTLLSWLPTFFKETFPNSKGWVFNVIPWLLAIPAGVFSGFLSDHLISLGFPGVEYAPRTSPWWLLTALVLIEKDFRLSLFGSLCRSLAWGYPAFLSCAWATQQVFGMLSYWRQRPLGSRRSTTVECLLMSRIWLPPVQDSSLVSPTLEVPCLVLSGSTCLDISSK